MCAPLQDKQVQLRPAKGIYFNKTNFTFPYTF